MGLLKQSAAGRPPSSCSSTVTLAAQPRNNATSRPASVLAQLQKGVVEVRVLQPLPTRIAQPHRPPKEQQQQERNPDVLVTRMTMTHK
jgi:hypothetical protein